jgi:hypothetical protein
MTDTSKMPFDEIARRAADGLEKLLRDGMISTDTSTMAAQPETQSLTYEQILDVVRELEQTKPPLIYYYAHESIPKFNKDGGNFIAQVKLNEHDVFFFHPDWLPIIKSQLGECVPLLTEFGLERYAREQAEWEWERHHPRPRSGGKLTPLEVGTR